MDYFHDPESTSEAYFVEIKVFTKLFGATVGRLNAVNFLMCLPTFKWLLNGLDNYSKTSFIAI